MDKQLLAMGAFAEVVDCKSFVRAAQRLSLSTTAVSRLVAELENHLGVRLLHRTTRRLSLTEIGASYHQHCRQVLASVEEMEALIKQDMAEPRGTLRISVQSGIARTRQWPALLLAYRRAYPEVTLNLNVLTHMMAPAEEAFDLALHLVGPLSGDSVTRPIATLEGALCAAPEYIERCGMPREPNDLQRHECLISAFSPDVAAWQFMRRTGHSNPVSVTVHGHVIADDGVLLHNLALAGAGILRALALEVTEDLAAGRLIEVMPGWRLAPVKLKAVYPGGRRVSAKARSFADFVGDHWGDELVPESTSTKASASAKPKGRRKAVEFR